MSIADRVRLMLMKVKPGYGTVETEESDSIANRSDARRRLRGNGPYQRFTADPHRWGSPYGQGRTRKKRAVARARVA